MFTEAMHGPIALTIFWIWLGFVAVAVLCYWLLRPWLKRPKTKLPQPVKYAEQLRQRMRKTPPSAGAAPSGGADTNRKPPSTRK
jgi:membrane protein implicated in regulation of membrane protease activity